MSLTMLVALVLGTGFGAGVWLVVTGLHGTDQPAHPGWRRRVLIGDRRLGRRGLAAAGGAVVVATVTGWVAGAVLAGVAVWALPGVLGPDRAHARRVARIEAVAAWTEMLRDTLTAAAGLEQAVLATVPIAPEPIQAEVTRLGARLEVGDRLAAALRRFAAEVADPTADFVVAALSMAAHQPAGGLAARLDDLAATARQRAAMALRVHASRARTRTSVRVIVTTTAVFAVGLVVLNRRWLDAYDTTSGQLVLLAIGALFAGGIAWMRHMTRPADTPFLDRQLTAGHDTGQVSPP